MTSKEAMTKLKENFENDVYKVEREMLNIIDKDLKVLEIIKKWTFIIQENYKDSYRKFAQFICNIHTIEMEEDFKKVKEWLENDNQREDEKVFKED